MLLSLAASPASPVRVVPCSAWNGGTESRGWTISSPAADGTLAIQFKNQKSDVATPLLCLDAAAGSTAAIPALAPCSAGSATQKWRTNPAGHFFTGGATSDSPGAKCLAVANSNYSVGPSVVLTSCYQHNNDRRQSLTWTVDATHTSIASNGAACCGDIYLKRPACLALDATPTCADLKIVARRTNTDVPWCDATKPAQVRAAALVAAMTLEEKATNMDSHNFGVPRLAVPINVFSEALHGMCSGCGAKVAFPGEYISTGCPTSFPQVISMGASWNRSLWSAVGTAVSNETRGLYSQGSGALSSGWEAALFLWAPNVNPFRDPRWGRGQEVVSEDPLVCGEYAAHYIPALQGILPRPDTIEEGGARVKQLPFLKTVATVKHFFDYDLEGSPGTPTSRQEIDVNVTARDQVEFFSPPFEAAITRGHSQSIMCSYNAVNGIPACLSSAMLNDKLRGDWQFDGFVVSDCDALSDGATHKYIERNFNGSLTLQAQQGVRGGTDLNCGGLYGEQAAAAVQLGELRESELDTALLRVYTKAFQLGILDSSESQDHSPGSFVNPNPYAKLDERNVDTPAHRALALEGALQGQVLLKNVANRLPLKKEMIGKLALIGPHANGSIAFLGGKNYYGANTLVDSCSPLLRARARLGTASVSYAEGCDISTNDTSGFASAVAAAKAADTVVLFIGIDGSIENEGHDRHDLTLPGVQEKLALAVAEAATSPVIVVLVNGGPLAIESLKESSKVGAILEAFLPGQFGAEAVIQLLLGEASPSGLLPVTVYGADFIKRRAITNLDLRGSGGVTYRYFDGVPLYPFGYGLSYAEFLFSGDVSSVLHTTVAKASAAKASSLCFKASVANVAGSDFTSDVVLLAFIASTLPDAPRNPKLVDFQRVAAVAPGETRDVLLCVNALGRGGLGLVDAEGNERVLPGTYTVTVGVSGGVGGSGAGSVVGTLIVAP